MSDLNVYLARELCNRRAKRQDDANVGDPYREPTLYWDDLTEIEKERYRIVAGDAIDIIGAWFKGRGI